VQALLTPLPEVDSSALQVRVITCARYEKEIGIVKMSEGQKQCSVDECNRNSVAKGYCMTHYQHARKGKLVQATDPSPRQPIAGSAVHEPIVEQKPRVITPGIGAVTKEVVTTEVLRWQVGDRSMPIEELSRDELLDAVRSLFEANGSMCGPTAHRFVRRVILPTPHDRREGLREPPAAA
jgi:hypothetical protein